MTLVALGATSLAQLAVVAILGSVALLADTIHNFSDALTALPLWLTFVVGRRAPTRRYTLRLRPGGGPGRALRVAMIALSAVVAGYESIGRPINPRPSTISAGLPWPGWSASSATRWWRSSGSASAARSDLRPWSRTGLHARTDGFTSLAVVLGAAILAAGWDAADPVVGLLITVAILAALRTAMRDIFRRLMDAVDPPWSTPPNPA